MNQNYDEAQELTIDELRHLMYKSSLKKAFYSY